MKARTRKMLEVGLWLGLCVTAFEIGLVILFVLLSLAGCGNDPCHNEAAPNVSGFSFEPTIATFDGYPVDGPDDVSLSIIDARIKFVTSCLDHVDWSTTDDAWCYTEIQYPVVSCRECLGIKITDEWHWSNDGKYQLLNIEVLEEDKMWVAPKNISGKPLNYDQPMFWRAGMQAHGILVTPPDMQLFEATLVQYLSGCINPWADEQLNRCTEHLDL